MNPRGYWRWRRTAAHDEFRAARDLLIRHRADLERAHAEFRWPRFESFNWALEWFDVIADGNPATALDLPDGAGGRRRLSFADLSRRSDAVAAGLRDLGVRRGDRLLLVLDVVPELWDCLLAALKLGAVVVPAYPSITGAELTDRLRRGRIRHLVAGAGAAALVPPDGLDVRVAVPGGVPGWHDYPDVDGDPRAFEPDGATPAADVAFGYFTSGTTALPKLVAHSHVSYPVGHLASLYWNGLRPGDRHLAVSAPGWAKHSWTSFFVPWTAEAAVLVPPAPVDGLPLACLLDDLAATSFCAPPSVWQAVRPYLSRVRPAALREATSAGEPLDPALAAEVLAHWRVPVRDGYGQSEATGLIGTTPGESRPGWLGRPLPGYRITLRDPDSGTEADVGEICVELAGAPVGMMVGYLHGDELRPVDGDHYRTGDLGERRDGWIRVLGRRDDVFKCAGHRVSPYEIEAVLRGHPHVAEAAVFPGPGHNGPEPHAVVVPHGPDPAAGRLAEEVRGYAAARLAPELCPRSISVRESLPRTSSGKIRRSALASAAGADHHEGKRP